MRKINKRLAELIELRLQEKDPAKRKELEREFNTLIDMRNKKKTLSISKEEFTKGLIYLAGILIVVYADQISGKLISKTGMGMTRKF